MRFSTESSKQWIQIECIFPGAKQIFNYLFLAIKYAYYLQIVRIISNLKNIYSKNIVLKCQKTPYFFPLLKSELPQNCNYFPIKWQVSDLNLIDVSFFFRNSKLSLFLSFVKIVKHLLRKCKGLESYFFSRLEYFSMETFFSETWNLWGWFFNSTYFLDCCIRKLLQLITELYLFIYLFMATFQISFEFRIRVSLDGWKVV